MRIQIPQRAAAKIKPGLPSAKRARQLLVIATASNCNGDSLQLKIETPADSVRLPIEE